jgi:hypothetical protein
VNEHVIRVFGGYDYDAYVRCSCGAYVLEQTHNGLTIADLVELQDSHIREVDNERSQG